MNLFQIPVSRTALCLILLFITSFTFPQREEASAQAGQAKTRAAAAEAGAWRLATNGSKDSKLPAGATAVKIAANGWFTVAYYDQAGKKFLGTYGGTYTLSDGQLTERYEYNTWDSTQVGTSASFRHTLQNGNWQLSGERDGRQVKEVWQRIDDASNAPLAGAWRISQRADSEGKLSTIQRGPRKTIKMLSGTRFQWTAFNTDTKEFFGTGGGTYTAENGTYTETIEFFSRDSSRVGAKLSFDFDVKDNAWHHSGLSSTGNKIYEVWQQEYAASEAGR